MPPSRRLAIAALLVVGLAGACGLPGASPQPCNDDDECNAAQHCERGVCVSGVTTWPRVDAGGARADAGPVDGGGDAGASPGSDAGAPDGGDVPDAGVTREAGAPDDDAGVDGGSDAGVVADAGYDAGPNDEPPLPNISGLSGYSVVYSVQIPIDGARFNFTGAPYAMDASAALSAPFTRVGYYLELQRENGPLYYVYVEADAVSEDVRAIGVPTSKSDAFFQRDLHNTRVESNHPGVTTGSGLALNMEFWPSDYSASNDDAGISPANADDLKYDFGDGDAEATAGHGSMQIHNRAEGRTLLAFNDWGGGHPAEALEIGIGNQADGEPDWTHANNAAAYVVKTLHVVVNARPAAPVMPAAVPGPAQNIQSHVAAEDLAGYRLVYDLDIPEVAAFNSGGVPYSEDNAALIPAGSFDRIAYFMELEATDGGTQWVWVSVAAFTLDAERTGVPATSDTAGGPGVQRHFQHRLEDGSVRSNVVVEGDGLTTLHIEFWGTNYQANNALPVAGASGSVYDFGDRPSAGSYGSMQIHDAARAETLFAYNRWGGSSEPGDVGIGNSPTGNPDWTFEANAGAYVTRRLQVLVRERP